jgi:murein L,D-transpeptidase YcbB/YkuD
MIRSEEPIAREVELTGAALAYGDALAHGLAKPETLFKIFALDRNDASVDEGLARALTEGDLSAWMRGLAPADKEYEALSTAYLAYRESAGRPAPQALPEGKSLKPGMSDPRVPQLVQLLNALGYSAALSKADVSLYDPAVVATVQAFQNDNGINADGVLGADTVAALNAGPDDRARQLALNLEARRWLKRQVPQTRIDVNTACAFQTYYRDGRMADSRRVVAGKPGAETPNLSSAFKQLVVNPPWNVPQGIAEDMKIVEGRVVQSPGPKSSLGLVKFDMQNRYAIYLHDTPSKARFNDNERHFSHGCVRVADAVGFARALCAEHGTVAEFDQKLSAGETAVVDLGAETAVRLLYHTAFVDPQGRVGFRPDIYGWDAKLAEALGMNPPLRRGLASPLETSIGP